MFNKDLQYVNMIRTQQNLKLDYQLIQNNIVSKNEQSTFLLDSNLNSNDLNLKIKSLENTNTNTYISAICENESQIIVSSKNPSSLKSKSVFLDKDNSVLLENENIKNEKQKYNNGEIDYLISAYSILQSVIINDQHAKSLNILILNDKLYSIILNKDKTITYSCIKKLTPYDEIDSSSFFNDDEVSRQKLYEEMYLLELQTTILDITKDYYEKNPHIDFLDNINIYYNIVQLNNEQVESLTKNIMIDVKYKQISLDSIIYSLVKKQSINKRNLITVRNKKSTIGKFLFLIMIFILLLFAAIMLFDFKKMQMQKDKTQEKMNNQMQTIEEISLPNHQVINKEKLDFIVKLFSTFGNNFVLKEIQIEKDDSTLLCNFANKNSYEDILKGKLEKIYKNSQTILRNKKNGIYTAIISNTQVRNIANNNASKIYKPNQAFPELDKKKSLTYLNSLMSNSTLTFISTSDEKYTTYKYNVVSNIKTPNDFYSLVESINNQYYSITLSYPIEFVKLDKFIKVSYTISINQKLK